MITFLGSIFQFVLDLTVMAVHLVLEAIEVVLAILGGVASLLFSFVGIALIVLLAVVFIRRHRRRKQPRERSDILVDENGETFTSFYHRHDE